MVIKILNSLVYKIWNESYLIEFFNFVSCPLFGYITIKLNENFEAL